MVLDLCTRERGEEAVDSGAFDEWEARLEARLKKQIRIDVLGKIEAVYGITPEADEVFALQALLAVQKPRQARI